MASLFEEKSSNGCAFNAGDVYKFPHSETGACRVVDQIEK